METFEGNEVVDFACLTKALVTEALMFDALKKKLKGSSTNKTSKSKMVMNLQSLVSLKSGKESNDEKYCRP